MNLPRTSLFSRGWHSALTAALATLTVSACAQLGPDLVKAGRNDYNIAIQQTEGEELVLNIVRLRYGDRPLYMDVGSVSTQFSWNQGLTASYTSRQSPAFNEAGVEGKLEYSERPTITYTPLGGADFVRGLLTPLDMNAFVLLVNSGWSIERLLRLTVDRMNGLENAPTAAGPTPWVAPRYAKFRRVAELLRALQVKGALDFGYRRREREKVPTLYIEADALDWDETRELYSLLGFEPGRTVFKLNERCNTPHRDALGINTRSLMEMGFFLSHGVDIPQQHATRGIVNITRDAKGEPFDWSQVVGGLFNIRSSTEKPADANISIRYRGHWFYIADSDINTKYTILLTEQLGALLGGKVEKAGPVLTLPIGG